MLVSTENDFLDGPRSRKQEESWQNKTNDNGRYNHEVQCISRLSLKVQNEVDIHEILWAAGISVIADMNDEEKIYI